MKKVREPRGQPAGRPLSSRSAPRGLPAPPGPEAPDSGAGRGRLLNAGTSQSRAVPSGEVYRQLFDAQVQLSRSLLAGRRDTRTDCLSAEDSNTHCSTTSSKRPQEDNDDVSRLPDVIVVDRPSSDIVERLAEKKRKKHQEALKQLDAHLTHLSQVTETKVRSVSQQLMSSLQDTDLRLDSLKVRMEHLDHASLQEVCVLWEEVEEEVKLKKSRIMELDVKLSDSERRRAEEIRVILRKFARRLEEISFLPPSDVHRLIHAEAMMLNQSLLANHRSIAHLLLRLQEENLQKESLLRRRWEDCRSRWGRSRVSEVIDQFRSLCGGGNDQQLTSGQQVRQSLRDLTEQRRDIIYQLCSLVPPSRSSAPVSDWFNQLAAVNQQIDGLHGDVLHQLRCAYEQVWQDRLAEVERCKEALSALQLSDEEVEDVVSSQLLPLIGRWQSQDEQRLAALDVCSDSAAHHAITLSSCVFTVMRWTMLLWETHSCRLERREEELQRHLDDLRHSQQQHIQRKKECVDDMLAGLRQESSEDTLKTSLDRTVCYLQDVQHSCGQCVSDQLELLDRLPSAFMEELLSYSSSLCSLYRLSHTYRPSPEQLKNLHLWSSTPVSPDQEASGEAETPKPEETTEKRPISCENDGDPAPDSQDWLTETQSSLLQLYDLSSDVTLTSSGGVVYSGPAFRCSSPDLPDGVDTHLSVFPAELLSHTLNRTRTLFVDHLEQHFQDVLSLAVAMVTERKEAVRSYQELQLQQFDPQHVLTHVYQPRLAELKLRRQRVDVHCEDMLDVLTSCWTELQELQASINRKNQDFAASLSNMEDNVRTANSSRRLQVVSSALQDHLDQHIKHIQCCQSGFRQTVHLRLEEARNRTTHLLTSFRSFGEDFAPQELQVFQRRLKEETRQMSLTEESILSELDDLESRSLQQVKEASAGQEEKLSSLQSELTFTERVEKIIRSTAVHVQGEAASSNQQQSEISSRLEDLKTMMEDTQVSPDEVISVLSSLHEDVRRRCQYLDFELDSAVQESLVLSACLKSRRQVRPDPPPGLLQPSGTGVELLDVVDVIRSLSRFGVTDSAAESERRGRPGAGQRPGAGPSPVQRQQRGSALRRFQIFGPEPDLSPQSLRSKLSSRLWTTNDVLLQAAEDFYCSKRRSRFQLLPDSLDQWAESMQQRLLGYQEQGQAFLSTSREEVVKQLSVLEELLRLFPAVLISNHERQHGAGLREQVGGVRQKLEQTLTASEEEKAVNVRELRVSLGEDELQTLNSREELRQQQLHSATCCAHLELQECVRLRGEEFVTSLSSLTEKLLCHLDDLLSPAETDAAVTHQHCEDSSVTMETGAETGGNPGSGTADPPSSVTMPTTASITTARYTLGHQAVIEQRDAAAKRFDQLVSSESSCSDGDKRRRLSEQQCWNTHWRREIHTLKHTHTSRYDGSS